MTSSNATDYGLGTNGQILCTSGEKVYWKSLSAGDVNLGNVTNHAQIQAIANSTENAIVRFSNTSGQVKNSKTLIDDNGYITITHISNTARELQITNNATSPTINFWWGIGSGNENHGLYDQKKGSNGAWILSANLNNDWTFNGTATNATNAINATNATNVTGVVDIEHGGTGKTTAIEAITNLGGIYLNSGGNLISSGTDINTLLTHSSGGANTYCSISSALSQTLEGDVPTSNSGFKLINYVGYTNTYDLRQFATGSLDEIFYRHYSYGTTVKKWSKWYKFVLLPSTFTDDKSSFSAIGGASTPVYVASSGVITACAHTIEKSVPSDAVFTDTQVTSATNHYTPSRDTSADKTASASGATAAWSIDVVKGITLQTDGKGHVTDVTVTSGKIPSNPNTDTKVTHTAATTTKYYITGTTTSTTNTGEDTFDTGIYATTVAGEFSAVRHSFNDNGTEKVYITYNNTNQSLDFVFV